MDRLVQPAPARGRQARVANQRGEKGFGFPEGHFSRATGLSHCLTAFSYRSGLRCSEINNEAVLDRNGFVELVGQVTVVAVMMFADLGLQSNDVALVGLASSSLATPVSFVSVRRLLAPFMFLPMVGRTEVFSIVASVPNG